MEWTLESWLQGWLKDTIVISRGKSSLLSTSWDGWSFLGKIGMRTSFSSWGSIGRKWSRSIILEDEGSSYNEG